MQSCYLRLIAINKLNINDKIIKDSDIDFCQLFNPIISSIINYMPFPQNGVSFDMSLPIGKDSVSLALILPDESYGFSKDFEISKLFVSMKPPMSILNKNVSESATGGEKPVPFRPFSSKNIVYSLSPNHIITLHNWLLLEKSLLVIGNDGDLSDISDCCYGLLTFLLPFEWKNLFVPLLPNSLIDMIGVCY
jgi:hypothetical protein